MIEDNAIHEIISRCRSCGYDPTLIKNEPDFKTFLIDKDLVIEADELSYKKGFVKLILISPCQNVENKVAEIIQKYYYHTHSQLVLRNTEKGKQIGLCAAVELKNLEQRSLKYEIHRLGHELQQIIPEESLEKGRYFKGLKKITVCCQNFIPTDNYQNIENLFRETIFYPGPKLYSFSGRFGCGKKTTVFQALNNLKKNVFVIENEGTIQISDLCLMLADYNNEMMNFGPNDNCLVITDLLADSFHFPLIYQNEILYRSIKQISLNIPVIWLTTVENNQGILNFSLASKYRFLEIDDQILIGRIIQTQFPGLKKIVFNKKETTVAEPLASIRLNFKKT